MIARAMFSSFKLVLLVLLATRAMRPILCGDSISGANDTIILVLPAGDETGALVGFDDVWLV